MHKISLNSAVFEKMKISRGAKGVSGSVMLREFSTIKPRSHQSTRGDLHSKDYNDIFQLHYGDKIEFGKSASSSTEYKMVSWKNFSVFWIVIDSSSIMCFQVLQDLTN